jgi:uncharacterized damage-inducible protein DinB
MTVRFAVLMLLGSVAGFAQLTNSERDFALSHLYASEKLFLDSVDGLSPAQFAFRAAPNRWSIAERAEHIASAEDFYFSIVKKVVKAPAVANHTATQADDERILAAMLDPRQKTASTEPNRPASARPADLDAAIAHFKLSRAQVLDYIRSTQDDLRHHVSQNPAGGVLDGYQWILVLSANTERQVGLIQDTKADSSFPK